MGLEEEEEEGEEEEDIEDFKMGSGVTKEQWRECVKALGGVPSWMKKSKFYPKWVREGKLFPDSDE